MRARAQARPGGDARSELPSTLLELAAAGKVALAEEGPWPDFEPAPLGGRPAAEIITEERR